MVAPSCPLYCAPRRACRYEALVDNPAHVHHMIVYACTSPPPQPKDRYRCESMDLECRCGACMYACMHGGESCAHPCLAGCQGGLCFFPRLAIAMSGRVVLVLVGASAWIGCTPCQVEPSGLKRHHASLIPGLACDPPAPTPLPPCPAARSTCCGLRAPSTRTRRPRRASLSAATATSHGCRCRQAP